MPNETRIHRTARKLQRLTGVSYQQARNPLEAAPVLPELTSPEAAQAFLVSARPIEPAAGFGPGSLFEVVIDDEIGHSVDTFDWVDLPEGLRALLGTQAPPVTWTADDGGVWTVRSGRTAVLDVADLISSAADVGGGRHSGDTLWPELPDVVRRCLDARTHLRDCDDDGFCNACGYQDGVDEDGEVTPVTDYLLRRAHTGEAGDLSFVAGLSHKVLATRHRDGSWILACVSDDDHVNHVVADPLLCATAIEAWFSEHHPDLVVVAVEPGDEVPCVTCGEQIAEVASGWSHVDEPDLNADHEPLPV